jgi:hypothetical protein
LIRLNTIVVAETPRTIASNAVKTKPWRLCQGARTVPEVTGKNVQVLPRRSEHHVGKNFQSQKKLWLDFDASREAAASPRHIRAGIRRDRRTAGRGML